MNSIHKRLLRILLFFVGILFISFSSYCSEQYNDLLIGFIDNGLWHQKGNIFLEINLEIDINQIILEKYYKKAQNKDYIEIAYSDLKDYVTIKHDQIFQIYSKRQYHGQFKIEKFIALSNACSGEYLLYLKLKGQIPVNEFNEFSKNYIIAKKSTEKGIKPDFKVISAMIPGKDEETQIKKILSDKLEFAMNKLLISEITELEKKSGSKLKFETKYKIFNVIQNTKESYSIVNAVWHYNNDSLESDTGYYITNTFIVYDDKKIIDIFPIELSFDSKLNIPKMEYGITFGDKNEIKWLIEYEEWERGYIVLVEFDKNKSKIVLRGIEFGC